MGELVTFTLDLEDHRPSDAAEIRYPTVTRGVLDFLDARDVRGTFFVVGEIAEAEPDLVREVAARGHEVALHGWRHTPLTELDEPTFRADLIRGKALLEELTGRPVVGLPGARSSRSCRNRVGRTDVLADVGFTYSSSVLPAKSPLFGDPGLPTTPFRWPSGVVELPCPVVRVGPVGLPYLGGVYLRALPKTSTRVARRVSASGVVLWTYCHPYDFDPDEPFWVVPEAGPLGSRLLWYNRRRTFARIEAALRDRVGPPLGERVSTLTVPTLNAESGQA